MASIVPRSQDPPTGALRRKRSAKAAGGIFTFVAALAPLWVATGASATSSYCTMATSYAASESVALAPASSLVPRRLAVTEKTALTSLSALQPKILAAAPAQLRSSFRTVFADLQQLYNAEVKANFNLLEISGQIAGPTATLVASLDAALAPVASTITSYDASTCHLTS